MSRMTHDFDALAAFFAPAAVASILKDVFDDISAEFCGDESGIFPASRGVATVHDQAVLKQLLPQDVYAYWRQAGYLGSYCMTFMLRHTVAFLALAAHERAFSVCGLEQVFKKYFSFSCSSGDPDFMDVLAEIQSPALGFSALGIHFIFRQTGACRAFDFYDIGNCREPAQGLFCQKHTREAWWEYEGPGASVQAEMFRYYALKENLYAYDEHQLEELVGTFWSHVKKFRKERPVPDIAVSEALAFFGYAALSDLRSGGQLKLRRRYTERARELHPDLGGGHESFLPLKRHYEVLRNRLSYENAAVCL